MNNISNAKNYLTECCHLSDYSLYKDEYKTLNDYIYICPICDEEQVVYNHGENIYHCFACHNSFNPADVTICECRRIMLNTDSLLCPSCFAEKLQLLD